MNEIMEDKIVKVERFLEELEPIIPETFEEYEQDYKTKAICERYFEKIVESVVDMAFLIIKDRELKIPREDRTAFNILSENKIIRKELAVRLSNAKGMRNILAHEYGSVDDALVFNSVRYELIDDAIEFIKSVEGLESSRQTSSSSSAKEVGSR